MHNHHHITEKTKWMNMHSKYNVIDIDNDSCSENNWIGDEQEYINKEFKNKQNEINIRKKIALKFVTMSTPKNTDASPIKTPVTEKNETL